MLKLRRDQVTALYRDEEHRQLVMTLIEHLRRHQALEVAELDDAELGAHIEACLVRAGSFGLTTRRDCARFVCLAACRGWSFDADRPWVGRWLSDPALGPSERLARVYERCVHELEAEALAVPRKRKYGI
jgi:hypothetical protein